MGKKKTNFSISMKDVARLSGVSTMTVSRAMHNPEMVQPETLERIRAVIDTVGYVPNRVAGNLSSNRTTQVALIVPALGNTLYAETIQGISSVLQREHFQLMISDCGYSLGQEEALIRTYVALRVCGIILHNTQHTDNSREILKKAGIPCVEIGNLCNDPIDMLVSYSNYKAGLAVAEHLLALGYRRIGFASLDVRQSDRLRERRRGFLAGLRNAGVGLDRSLVLEVGPGLHNGAQALVRILEIDPRVNAVFFAGDVLAAGAILECQRRGIKVPDDIAIVASDDNDLMRNINPPISTVRFPRYEIGVKSAELIVARAQEKLAGPSRIDLGFEFIRRGST